jgi:hypothetical protein
MERKTDHSRWSVSPSWHQVPNTGWQALQQLHEILLVCPKNRERGLLEGLTRSRKGSECREFGHSTYTLADLWNE